MFEIIKGTCFFLYCPFLPLWWIVELGIEIIKRKIKRNRRRKAYRRAKIKKMKAKANEFLSMDDYARGKTTKKTLNRGKRKREERQDDAVVLQPTLEDMEGGFDLQTDTVSQCLQHKQGKDKQRKRRKKQKQPRKHCEPFSCHLCEC